MPSAVVDSAFDIARWMMDRARLEDSYLQAQKLQRMLWLAQGNYAAAYHGRKLMPAVFVAREQGPVDPNIFRAFELGRPDLPDVPLPPEVEDFLDRVWRRYAHHSTEHLSKVVRGHDVFAAALAKGEGEEIPFTRIAKYFQELQRMPETPEIRTPDGRVWKKWSPRRANG